MHDADSSRPRFSAGVMLKIRWKIGQDAHGCPMWIEPEVIDQQCCGCPFEDADYDAGLLDSDAGG
jgi:hypothetical protein